MQMVLKNTYLDRGELTLLSQIKEDCLVEVLDSSLYLEYKSDKSVEEFTAEWAKIDADRAKREGIPYALQGVEYLVPVTNDDAIGLLQVKSAFELGLTKTNIHFSNGTVVPINATDFEAFATWFVTERNKYFI